MSKEKPNGLDANFLVKSLALLDVVFSFNILARFIFCNLLTDFCKYDII